jgi:hypothetical protein
MVPDYLVAVESAPRSCNFLTNIFTYVFNYKIATPKKEVFFFKSACNILPYFYIPYITINS